MTLKKYTELLDYSKYIADHIIKGQDMYLNAETSIPMQDIILFDNKLS